MSDEPEARRRGRPSGKGPRQQEALRVAEAAATPIMEHLDGLNQELTALRTSFEMQLNAAVERVLAEMSGNPELPARAPGADDTQSLLGDLAAAVQRISVEIHQTHRDDDKAGHARDSRLARLEQAISELTAAAVAAWEQAADRTEQRLRGLLTEFRAVTLAELDHASRRTDESLAKLPTADDIRSAVGSATEEADVRAARRHDDLLGAIERLEARHAEQPGTAASNAAAARSLGATMLRIDKLIAMLRPVKPAGPPKAPPYSREAARALLACGLEVSRVRTQASHPTQFPTAEYILNGGVRVQEHPDGSSSVFVGTYRASTGLGMQLPYHREIARAALDAVQRHEAAVTEPLGGATQAEQSSPMLAENGLLGRGTRRH
jgi:uncharacterized coiled-coil protein SlyX